MAPARQRINRALTHLIGYRVVSANTPAPVSKPRPKKLPDDYDDEAKAIIRAVRPYTMTSHEKLFGLICAIRHVTRHGIPGDLVECGVWRGGSMHAAARTLSALGDTSRTLHLFDTFEGMPAPTDRDQRHDGVPAAELLAKRERDSTIWAVATLEDVREGFASVPYPSERVRFVKGLVEDTIPQEAPEQIAVLRLDTDWYESTRHELEQLYPRLSSGGVLVIDDYGLLEGLARGRRRLPRGHRRAPAAGCGSRRAASPSSRRRRRSRRRVEKAEQVLAVPREAVPAQAALLERGAGLRGARGHALQQLAEVLAASSRRSRPGTSRAGARTSRRPRARAASRRGWRRVR